MKRVILVLALALVLIVGCAPAMPDDVELVSNNIPIRRYVDEEAGVVCWMYYSNGISCLPVDQTKLEVTQ